MSKFIESLPNTLNYLDELNNLCALYRTNIESGSPDLTVLSGIEKRCKEIDKEMDFYVVKLTKFYSSSLKKFKRDLSNYKKDISNQLNDLKNLDSKISDIDDTIALSEECIDLEDLGIDSEELYDEKAVCAEVYTQLHGSLLDFLNDSLPDDSLGNQIKALYDSFQKRFAEYKLKNDTLDEWSDKLLAKGDELSKKYGSKLPVSEIIELDKEMKKYSEEGETLDKEYDDIKKLHKDIVELELCSVNNLADNHPLKLFVKFDYFCISKEIDLRDVKEYSHSIGDSVQDELRIYELKRLALLNANKK